MKYNPVELIIKKREGAELSRSEIRFFVGKYLEGEIPEYQMSAMLMAIFFGEMKPEEVQTLTEIYIESGASIKFAASENTVDKHSTGGVGDKITIPLAPIVAACGAKIPMISGRGLGHTGGTLDKLESIPGLRTDFSESDFRKFIDSANFSIISQSEKLVPADRRIYALRDVTGTVESLPLITASIMSKKIAEGAQNLVVDLKVGSGAFIKTIEQAERLGKLLAQTGENLGQKVTVVFSDMNSPLGHYIGNALEVKESIEYLQGKRVADIHLLTKTLAIEMLLLSKIAADKESAGELVEQVIDDGSALEYFRKFIINQGGDPQVCDNPQLLPQAKYQIPLISPSSGWVEAIDSQQIGFALIGIDAGRKTLDSKLDYSSGAYFPLKIGDKIEQGDEIGQIYCNDEAAGKVTAAKILNSIHFSAKEISARQLIIKIVDNWE
ncbi:MAG: thymidine phosphorylase [Candidatus Cloacimonadales bacterium]